MKIFFSYAKYLLFYKIIDIVFIIKIYFLLAFFLAIYLDKLNNIIFDNNNNKKNL
jgi:hypothetical protein